MWRLRIGAKAGDKTHLFSTNNFVGRQIWEFDANSGSPEELAKVEEARRNFTENKSRFKTGADLLWRMQFLKEKKFEQKIPQVKIEDAEKITYEDAKTALTRGLLYFRALQADDGHWPGENAGQNYVTPPFVICLYITGHLEKIFSREHRIELLRYMYNHQNEDGGWGLDIESLSSMFCTVLNYICLRILGEEPNHDDPGNACARARKWILDHGGASYSPSIAKAILSVLGVYDWSGCKPLPPEFWLLPSWFPVNGGTLMVYARDSFMALSYLYGKRFVATPTPLILQLKEEIYPEPYAKVDWRQSRFRCAKEDLNCPQSFLQDCFWKSVHIFSENILSRWPFNNLIRQRALRSTMELVHYHDESTRYITGGTLMAFHMLACWVEDPESDYFKKHIARVPDAIWIGEDGLKIQISGSQLWDTVFALHVLINGLDEDIDDEIKLTLIKGYDFLKKSQIRENPPGDHLKMFRGIRKGAWTFSDQDQGLAVSDCTAESLECCLFFESMPIEFTGKKMNVEKLYDAVNFLLQMQSANGGMTVWEPANGKTWLDWFSTAELFEKVVMEYEYVECTGSVIVALAQFKKQFPEYRKEEIEELIRKGVKYIEEMQLEDGSWYGTWGVCFIYGTLFAVRGLVAAGKTYNNCKAIRRAVGFILDVQNPDGGWGESCLSCSNKKYTPLPGNNTHVTSTGQALMVLLLAGQMDINPLPVYRGAKILINSQLDNGDFPQQELIGVLKTPVMLHFPAYRNIFPLWALTHYTQALWRLHP